MKIAFVGTRGIPARYGGFETAVEEVAIRLVAMGHEVTVYCRNGKGAPRPRQYQGVQLVWLPALRSRVAETLSHTLLSALHLLFRKRADAIILMNAANSPLLPLLLAAAPTAVHVDGLEWQRAKWGRLGRRYYKLAERLATMTKAPLIADAQGIADYYREEYARDTVGISYGAAVPTQSDGARCRELGLVPGQFHLLVARFEPENHVLDACRAYVRSACVLPLVVVGSAPYSHRYTQDIMATVESDARVRLLGGVWDQQLLDDLYSNCRHYIHGHSVGGTNPSLLRAMAAGAPVAAFDVVFNREVLAETGRFWTGTDDLEALLTAAERAEMPQDSAAVQARAAEKFDWDDVARAYAELADTLGHG